MNSLGVLWNPEAPVPGGLIRARLILEYDDGQVHCFEAESPAEAVMHLDYDYQASLGVGDFSVLGPSYIAAFAVSPVRGVTLGIKAGPGKSMRYRNDPAPQ